MNDPPINVVTAYTALQHACVDWHPVTTPWNPGTPLPPQSTTTMMETCLFIEDPFGYQLANIKAAIPEMLILFITLFLFIWVFGLRHVPGFLWRSGQFSAKFIWYTGIKLWQRWVPRKS